MATIVAAAQASSELLDALDHAVTHRAQVVQLVRLGGYVVVYPGVTGAARLATR
jgi:hypothetical protein